MKRFITTIILLAFATSAHAIKRGSGSNDDAAVSEYHPDEYKVIFTHEFNVYYNTTYLNDFLQYFDKHWNVGVQVYNIRPEGSQMQNYESDTYFNGSYKFEVYDDINLELGGQLGTNMNNKTPQQAHSYDFYDFSKTFLGGKVSLHGGGYYVNDSLATIHQPYNWQTGIKIKLDKFTTTLDYFGGYNNMSGAVVNVSYKLYENFRPYIGIQVPETNSGNEFCGNIGFSVRIDTLFHNLK